MGDIIINALQRPAKSGKFREQGFIPGVLYGEGVEKPTAVKFDEITLKKILATHGANAKLWVKYDNHKIFGFIKEIQRETITMKLIHVDVQLVSKNQEVKMQIPINFKGEDSLILKQLDFHINKPEIDVLGKASIIPDIIDIDISNMQLGDTITTKDFSMDMDSQIKIIGDVDEIYGVVTHLKHEIVEEVIETETETKAIA